jgi:AGCS family alanine or glycine:cation symporter
MLLEQVKQFLWGPFLLLPLLLVSLYLGIYLRGYPYRKTAFALRNLFFLKSHGKKGDISQFEAVMTSLAGAIGTGSIVGVATAVAVGGFGAIFWMWIAAILGMATKYAESFLAVHYRKIDAQGEMIGGPMEYMEVGLKARWMALLFAFFGSFAALGTGNLVQVNAIVEASQSLFDVSSFVIGIVVAICTGLVILGGVKSIGHVAALLVPIMALFYLLGGVAALAFEYARIPEALSLIFRSAFTAQAPIGGFAGTTLAMAIQMGVSRSIFSNEAGLGISSIAAAAAKTDHPARQALVTMVGALFSTLIVCTITGLVIATAGVFGEVDAEGNLYSGATLAVLSFSKILPLGRYVVSIGLILFAFSTIIAWAYYGEKCAEYLLSEKAVLPFRFLFVLTVLVGALLQMHVVWTLADIANALIVIPNLIALVALSSVVKKGSLDLH